MIRSATFSLAALAIAWASSASGSDQTLAATLVPKIKQCMQVPEMAKVTDDTATIEIELLDGQLVGEPKVVVNPATKVQRAMLAAAIRAVKKCSPYPPGVSMTIRVKFFPNE